MNTQFLDNELSTCTDECLMAAGVWDSHVLLEQGMALNAQENLTKMSMPVRYKMCTHLSDIKEFKSGEVRKIDTIKFEDSYCNH